MINDNPMPHKQAFEMAMKDECLDFETEDGNEYDEQYSEDVARAAYQAYLFGRNDAWQGGFVNRFRHLRWNGAPSMMRLSKDCLITDLGVNGSHTITLIGDEQAVRLFKEMLSELKE